MAITTESAEVPPNVRRVYDMDWAGMYPLYVQKAEKKCRTKREVDEILRWLTGYTQRQVTAKARGKASTERFFVDAPALNPDRSLITGVVCGVRVEEVEHDTMREIRYLDKLIDELAKGKAMDKILRTPADA